MAKYQLKKAREMTILQLSMMDDLGITTRVKEINSHHKINKNHESRLLRVAIEIKRPTL